MTLAQIRDGYQAGLVSARARHDAGSESVSPLIADATDRALEAVSKLVLSTVAERNRVLADVSVVATGGYARRDLAPHSDRDLLFLTRGERDPGVERFIAGVVRSLWDAGIPVSQVVGTRKAMLDQCRRDPVPASALLETRLVVGSSDLLERFEFAYSRLMAGCWRSRLVRLVTGGIAEDRREAAETSFLLEPDLKSSPGGLRELHLFRWVARLTRGIADPRELARRGELESAQADRLLETHGWLCRLRNELHFHAGRAENVLTKSEQIRIARRFGYSAAPGTMPVERFMKDYFRRTAMQRRTVTRFVDDALPEEGARLKRELDLGAGQHRSFTTAAGRIRTSSADREWILGDWSRTIRFLRSAAGAALLPDDETLDSIRARSDRECPPELDLDGAPSAVGDSPGPNHPSMDPNDKRAANGEASTDAPRIRWSSLVPPSARPEFLDWLGRPGGLARSFRRLHEAGVLHRFLPPFEHARGLMQFNAYHKYTVDEHTFVMLQHAEDLEHLDSPVAREYRRIQRRDLLHAAILLHDLGKGCRRDHSEVGGDIARDFATHYRLSDGDRQTLVFLVEKHLLLATAAFQRDIRDEKLILQLAREIGDVAMLRKLYVLTIVDSMAVAPDNLTSWKAELLEDLFGRLRRVLADEPAAAAAPAADEAEAVRTDLLRSIHPDSFGAECVTQLDARLLREAADHPALAGLARLEKAPAEPLAIPVWSETHGTLFFVIVAAPPHAEGAFHKLCAALSAHRLDVLSARIATLPDGSLFDQFEVRDIHHMGRPGADRLELFSSTIRRVLRGEVSVTDVLWNNRSGLRVFKREPVFSGSTRVAIDNETAADDTIIDVFTDNRRGVLFTLAKGIHRLGLDVRFARIASFQDRVVDVFYVREADGHRAARPERIRMIQDHLARDLANLETNPRAMGF